MTNTPPSDDDMVPQLDEHVAKHVRAIEEDLEVVISKWLGHPCVNGDMLLSALIGTALMMCAAADGENTVDKGIDRIATSMRENYVRGYVTEPTPEERTALRHRLADAYTNRMKVNEASIIGVFRTSMGGGDEPTKH